MPYFFNSTQLKLYCLTAHIRTISVTVKMNRHIIQAILTVTRVSAATVQ